MFLGVMAALFPLLIHLMEKGVGALFNWLKASHRLQKIVQRLRHIGSKALPEEGEI